MPFRDDPGFSPEVGLRFLQIFLMLWLPLGGGGCGWTPQVETPIYESPQGLVTLRTISSRHPLQANHPLFLSTQTMEGILSGISTEKTSRLLKQLISGSPGPRQVFSPRQVKFLAPLLASALQQATPEEEVAFEYRSAGNPDSRPLSGKVLAVGETLVISWRENPGQLHVLSKERRSATTLSTSHSADQVRVHVSPPSAGSLQAIPNHPYLRSLPPTTVAVLYRQLESPSTLPPQGLPDLSGQEDETDEDRPRTIESGRSASDSPSVVEPPKPAFRLSGTTPTPETTGREDLHSLKQQIRQLREELANQKRELDRLKKESVPHLSPHR